MTPFDTEQEWAKVPTNSLYKFLVTESELACCSPPTPPNVFMCASLFCVYNKTHEDTSCPKYISLKHLLKFYMPCMSDMPCKVTQITNVLYVCVCVCVSSVDMERGC